jgi:hypothetical protein
VDKRFNDQSTLVAGEVVGMRAFNVRRDGTLTGPHTDYPFEPGENHAECNYGLHYYPFEAIGARNCSCGFYGYFYHASNSYHHGLVGTVQAIVKGTGNATVGTEGFRIEKAELLALVQPVRSEFDYALKTERTVGNLYSRTVPKQPRGLRKFWYRKLLPWAYEHDLVPFITFALGMLLMVVGAPVLGFAVHNTALAIASGVVGGILWIGSLYAGIQSMDRAWTKFDVPFHRNFFQGEHAHKSFNVTTPEVWEKVVEKYKVPVFKSMKEAQRAFPMTFFPPGYELEAVAAKHTEGR